MANMKIVSLIGHTEAKLDAEMAAITKDIFAALQATFQPLRDDIAQLQQSVDYIRADVDRLKRFMDDLKAKSQEVSP